MTLGKWFGKHYEPDEELTEVHEKLARAMRVLPAKKRERLKLLSTEVGVVLGGRRVQNR